MCDFAMLNIMPGKSSAFWREEAHVVERSWIRILDTISQALMAVGERDCRNAWSGGRLGEMIWGERVGRTAAEGFLFCYKFFTHLTEFGLNRRRR